MVVLQGGVMISHHKEILEVPLSGDQIAAIFFACEICLKSKSINSFDLTEQGEKDYAEIKELMQRYLVTGISFF